MSEVPTSDVTASDVTVGIPVYNNADTLERAVDSVRRQTWPGIRLLLSDDNSTDGSAAVAAALAERHGNALLLRQARNLGPVGNFKALLQRADTRYFMWLAGDDRIEPEYVRRTRAALEADSGLVTCVSRVLFTDPGGGSGLAKGTYALDGDPASNIARYLSDPADNARLYGLHRREALLRAFQTGDFVVAWDWALMAATLLFGRHAELPETLMVRDRTSWEAYMRLIRRHAPDAMRRVLPMLPMTAELLRRRDFPKTWPVLKALGHLNLALHLDYVRHFHPRYGRIEPWVRRHLLWRLDQGRG